MILVALMWLTSQPIVVDEEVSTNIIGLCDWMDFGDSQ